MRAYVIVSEHLVQFLWHDKEFLTRLQCIYQDTIQPSEDPTENGHLIEALIAPVVLSYFLLENNFDDACSVIKCSKVKCDAVFQRHDNLLYIGFCDTVEFSIYHMQKQLNVLHELTEFCFGPCQQNIKPLNLIDKSRTWSKLTCALQSFIELHENELCFLVGGIERLQLNPDLKKIYSNMVETCMKDLAQRLNTQRIAFGMLFIRNKVICYEIGPKFKHEISTSDLLKMMALINSKHKDLDLDTVVDASSAIEAFDLSVSAFDQSLSDVETSSQRRASVVASQDDGQVRDGGPSSTQPRHRSATAIRVPAITVTCDDDSVSLPDTPQDDSVLAEGRRMHISQSWHGHSSILNGRNSLPTYLQNKSASENEVDERSEEDEEDEDVDEDTIEPMADFPRHAVRSRRSSFPAVIGETSIRQFLPQIPRRNIQMFPVCLRTVSCRHTPFLMHLVQIAKDTTFILLAEMKGADVARMICQFLSLLKNIKFHSRPSGPGEQGSFVMEVEGGQKTYDKIGTCFKQLKSRLSHAADQLKRIVNLWEKNISRRLLAHFKQQKLSDLPRLEGNISELTKSLQTLYSRLYLVKPFKSKKSWRGQLEKFGTEMEKRLADHLEFFHAKTYRNISINWTCEQFPGMLHFTMIKRLKTQTGFAGLTGSAMPLVDEVFSSGLSIPPLSKDETETTDLELTLCFKNQVWKGIMIAYSNLDQKEGISEFSATDGDFRFTTYIWTKPVSAATSLLSNGLPAKSEDSRWKGKVNLAGFESPFANVRSSDSTSPFVFFELHLLHFSTVPRSMILEQGNRLIGEFEESKSDT